MAKRVLILAVGLLLLMNLGAFGARKPGGGKINKPAYLEPQKLESLYPTAGDTIGYTYWDGESSNRQIAADSLGNVHFTWTCLQEPDTTYGYEIYYNSRSPDGTWLAAGTGISVSNTWRASYSSVDILPDGREVLCYYLPPWGTTISIEKTTPGLGEFNQFDIPDSMPGLAKVGLWPSLAIAKQENGDTVYMHFIVQRRDLNGAGYVRCFIDPMDDTLLRCQAPGGNLMTIPPNRKMPNRTIYIFEPTRGILPGACLATSPDSEKVAISWIKQWDFGEPWSKGEVVYLESTNNGNAWMCAGNMGTPIQITNYGADSFKEKVWPATQPFYGADGSLQLRWGSESKHYKIQKILHWDLSSGKITETERYVDPSSFEWLEGTWEFAKEFVPTEIGIHSVVWLLRLPHWVGWCLTAYELGLHVGYLIFAERPQGIEVSMSGVPNSDLFIHGSYNDFSSSDLPVNITNTSTPNCRPGECLSESPMGPPILTWSSPRSSVNESPDLPATAESLIYILYLEDRDAGSAVYGQGEFTLNPIRYIALSPPPVRAVPRIVYGDDYDPWDFIRPPRWATNHNTATDSIKFDNIGTATLQVQLSGPSWLTAAPSSFSILELGPTQKVTLTLNGGPYADAFLTGKLKILSNNGVVGGGANFNDTEYVDINFVVTDTFYFAEFDTCKRGPVLVVSNVGNMAAQSDSAGMFYNGLNYLFDGTPLISTNQVPGFGSDTVGFSWMHAYQDFIPEGHLIKTDYPSLKTTVWIEKSALLNWRRANTDPTHWAWFGWTKWSKIIQFDWTPGNLHGILIKNWWTWNKPPKWWMDVTLTAPAGGYFGIGGDWDVTATYSGKDQGGIIDSLNLVYLRQDTVSTDKYYGGYQFLSAYVKKGATTTNYTTPFAMHVGNNRSELFKNNPSGYGDDSLYKTMSTPGDYIEPPDSGLDRHIVISAVEMLNPDTTTEIGIDYTAIVSDVNLVNFVRQAATFKKVKPGDTNVDGKVTVSDVVYLVNYLFKGGSEPWLMYSDANGDAKVTVSDVVYLVNYLFKGGPPAIFIVGAKPF